ncbi:MAG: hypothetical protein ACREP9_23045 [Candidatus Dormibacteraceae bacterium]
MLLEDTPNLANPEPEVATWFAQDSASSICIQPGPDFDHTKEYYVALYDLNNYGGESLVLPPGIYRDLHDPHFKFGDRVASVKFILPSKSNGEGSVEPTANLPAVPQACQIHNIPLVVKGYNIADFKSWRFITVEDVDIFGHYSGEWGDRFDSVKVVKGPNYAEGDTARLYSEPYYSGASVDLPPGNYPDLAGTKTPSIKNAMNSIRMGPSETEEIKRWQVLRDRAEQLRQCQEGLRKKKQQADHLDEQIRQRKEEQRRLKGDSPPLTPVPRTAM